MFDFLDDFSFRNAKGGLSSLTGGTVYADDKAYIAARDAGELSSTPLAYTKREYSFGELGTPQLWADFMRSAAGPDGQVEGAYRARLGGAVEGAYGGYLEAMRAAEASSRASGVPDYIARQRVNTIRPSYEASAAAGAYGAEAQRQEDLFGLLSAGTQKISEAAYFGLGLDLQKYGIKRAEKQAEIAFGRDLLSSAIGSVTQKVLGGGGGQ